MDVSSTRELADELGVTPNTIIRHARRLGITAEIEMPGIRGAKLWNTEQAYKLRESIRLYQQVFGPR